AEHRLEVGEWTCECDVAHDVCPWNHRAPATGEIVFEPREHPSVAELVRLDETTYRDRFRGSPLKRARREGLARNAAVALGNGGAAAAIPPRPEDPPRTGPVVGGPAP